MLLVTGATGFLGKRICRQLDSLNLEYSKTSLSLGTDLRDEKQTFKLFETVRPDYVLHCASYVGGIQFGLKHTGEMYRNGMLMQVNLFEACRKYNVKRLVNPISNCAYPGEATLFKESEFWNGPLHDSVLIYGMVRKMSYIGAIAYQRQYNVDTINLVLSNMYGPEDHFEAERSHALGALIMKFVDAKINNKPSITLWGTGKPVREWLHVDDGAKAMIKAMDIEFSGYPVIAPQFKVRIDNQDNKPVNITRVDAVYTVDKLIFEGTGSRTYHLWFGNPNAKQPHYDLKYYQEQLLKEKQDILKLSGLTVKNKEFTVNREQLKKYFNIVVIITALVLMALLWIKLKGSMEEKGLGER
jgi:GDP-L-fucose synthase